MIWPGCFTKDGQPIFYLYYYCCILSGFLEHHLYFIWLPRLFCWTLFYGGLAAARSFGDFGNVRQLLIIVGLALPFDITCAVVANVNWGHNLVLDFLRKVDCMS